MRALLLYLITAGFVSTAIAVSTAAPGTQTPTATQPKSLSGNIARGKYLAEHVAMCIECHSPRDESGRIIPGREFMGSVLPIRVPEGWAMRAPRNRGLPGYSDDQAMRLLTHGAIARDGRQLLSPMPRFMMTESDAADVIAFLRSLD